MVPDAPGRPGSAMASRRGKDVLFNDAQGSNHLKLYDNREREDKRAKIGRLQLRWTQIALPCVWFRFFFLQMPSWSARQLGPDN
jgi:hypothetical protein